MDDLENLFGKIPNWLRWPLIPITTVVTVVVVWFIASLLAKIFVFVDGGRGWGENFFQYLLIPGFSIYWSVVVGTAMAPRYRQFTTLLLGAVWAFAAGALTFMTVLTATWASLITVASACVGCALAVMLHYSEPEDSAALPELSSSE